MNQHQFPTESDYDSGFEDEYMEGGIDANPGIIIPAPIPYNLQLSGLWLASLDRVKDCVDTVNRIHFKAADLLSDIPQLMSYHVDMAVKHLNLCRYVLSVVPSDRQDLHPDVNIEKHMRQVMVDDASISLKSYQRLLERKLREDNSDVLISPNDNNGRRKRSRDNNDSNSEDEPDIKRQMKSC